MNPLTKMIVAPFAKALTAIRHPGRPLWTNGLLRRTRFDYRKEVGDCLDASVVTAPVQWIQRALPEATLSIRQKKRDDQIVEMPDHAMLALIQRPNDHYGDIALWAATVLSFAIDGNAYWIKVRNRAGKPVELWYVPHWMMQPKAPRDGSAFISHYSYTPGGGHGELILEPDDVVHFRNGLNPRDLTKGLSPLGGVIREIFIDLESSNFVASLLRNMGVPGVVISPKGGAMPAPDDVQSTKSWFAEAFGGDRRGGPLVMGAPTDVQAFGFNPQQLNMSEGRDVAEERVCACLGIPAAVVGFGAGLQQTKVGATMKELRQLAWHNGVLPMGRSLADELKRSLLADFGDTTGLDLYWDVENVLALQEDQEKQESRWNERVKSGGVTVFEYRQGLGMEADDSHRFYMRPINLIEVPEGEAGRNIGDDPAPGKEKKSLGQKEGDDDGPRASPAAMKRGEAFVRIVNRQQRGLEAAFEKPLKALFVRFGKAAGDAARELIIEQEGKSHGTKEEDLLVAQILEKLGIAKWTGELRRAYEAQYLEVAKTMSDAAERAGLSATLPDPVARSIVASGGRRAGMVDIEGQSRNAMFAALAEGRAEGEGAQALANRIAGHVEGGHWQSAETRARIIARTETKYAQNISTIERAKAGGVQQFIVFDGRLGPGRSLESHIARDGSIVSAAEADAMAAAEHPNGTLSFAPYFQEDE